MEHLSGTVLLCRLLGLQTNARKGLLGSNALAYSVTEKKFQNVTTGGQLGQVDEVVKPQHHAGEQQVPGELPPGVNVIKRFSSLLTLMARLTN